MASRNGAAAPEPSLPRYQRLADDLRKRIGAGKYPVGGYLPTEMELCRRYEISRHTVREALRQLRDAGLISRRRRVGTEVVARTPKARYRQPTSSIGDLLHYGEATELRILDTSEVECDEALAELLECSEGARWLRVNTLRILPGKSRPVCMAIASLDLRFPDLRETLAKVTGPISAKLERAYGIHIVRVDQSIQAIRLGKRQAKALRAKAGSPALRAVRRYYDDRGRLIQLSTATHPGERFTYESTLVRS